MDMNVATKSLAKPGMVELLYAIYDDVEVISGPVPSTTQQSKVVITGDHTFFVETDGWRKMFVNIKKSMLEFQGAGDEFAGSGEMRLKCFVPGNDKNVAAFIKDNFEYLFLVKMNPCQNGEYLQLGTKCDAARVDMNTVKWTSGTVDGKTTMGWEFDIMSIQDTIYYYQGVVTLPTE